MRRSVPPPPAPTSTAAAITSRPTAYHLSSITTSLLHLPQVELLERARSNKAELAALHEQVAT